MVITFLTWRIQLETYRKITLLVSLSLGNIETEKNEINPNVKVLLFFPLVVSV